ncbi:hypothetical protein LP7551_05474 [Roseibium album]|nr:hypothetical protein LP7551_05474 [Roseibium album]
MLITTTNTVQGKDIDYKGLVTGEAILGANLFKDIFAGIRDIVGGRSEAYEQELAKGSPDCAGRNVRPRQSTWRKCGDRRRSGLRNGWPEWLHVDGERDGNGGHGPIAISHDN